MIFELGFLQMTGENDARMMGLFKSKEVGVLGKEEKVYQSSPACEIRAHCCIPDVLVA